MVRALLVDDETHALRSLEILLGKCHPPVEVVGKARSVHEALALMDQLTPNLVFLDVEIPPNTGFDFLEECSEMNFEVVFVTAYNQHAVKAFKSNAIDYILKPIDIDELQEAVLKVSGQLNAKNTSKARYKILFENLKEILPHKVVVPTSDGFQYLDIKQIVQCSINNNFVVITHEDHSSSTFTLQNFDLVPLLIKRGFVGVTNDTFVNLSKVMRVDKTAGGRVITSNGACIPIRSMSREDFIDKLEAFSNFTTE